MKKNNLTGQKFGRLTVIKEIKSKCLVQCDCGVEKLVSSSNLTLSKTKSCGCLRTEISTEERAEAIRLLELEEQNTDDECHRFCGECGK